MQTQKRSLRAELKRRRGELGEAQRRRIDDAIAARVESLPAFVQANTVLTYLGFGDEVGTRHIICAAWERGKLVALPWCVPGTRRMRWFEVSSFDGLCRSRMGVEEPVPESHREVVPPLATNAIALVPGLSFDVHGYRIGYGGGYYDTFLAEFGGMSVGLCRESFVMDDLRTLGAVETHDLAVDMLISEKRIIYTNK